MVKDCSTCIYKEGSCYPSTTIFDKDKTCKSYNPDYEGYIAKLEEENAELKEKLEGAKKARQRMTDLGFPSFQSIKEYCAYKDRAKEIIRKLLTIDYPSTSLKECEKVNAEAERFLRET